MKKIISSLIFCITVLTSCLETGTHTTIKADGSGQLYFSMDVSEAIRMAAQGKPGENINMDTTIYMRAHSDTASFLTAKQKELLRGMTIKAKMDLRKVEEIVFKFSITAPFKSLEDLNALNTFMRQKEYDMVFDRAFKIPLFDDGEKGEGKENDNIFGSVVPAFYNCDYKKGSIVCRLDSVNHKKAVSDLEKMEMNLDDEKAEQMLQSVVFTNLLTLPTKAAKIEGGSWQRGNAENVLVQKGNLYDIYKNPEKYAYSIRY